jgi:hypothetical protein
LSSFARTKGGGLGQCNEWIRNKRKKKEEKYDPNGDFRKLDSMLPKKRNQAPESRARQIEGVLDWMRNNEISPNDENLPSFDKVLAAH